MEPPIRLRPFHVNPPSQEDIDNIRAQRIVCGWKVEYIPTWIKEIQAGERLMWFIHLPRTSPAEKPDEEAIGMVSLHLNDPQDATLANLRRDPPGDRVEVSALFIYPQYRRKGYGEAAILMMEEIARGLGAKVSTMNTAAAGENMAKYGRLGYREYKEKELRYPLDEILACGWTEEHRYAAFLEKRIG
ncbi:hypothetical protein FRB99_002475 [Tulasnella sp. 403]|nr:hypothetical protein FRB99_002475 [Tulasnella sp. 403]